MYGEKRRAIEDYATAQGWRVDTVEGDPVEDCQGFPITDVYYSIDGSNDLYSELNFLYLVETGETWGHPRIAEIMEG